MTPRNVTREPLLPETGLFTTTEANTTHEQTATNIEHRYPTTPTGSATAPPHPRTVIYQHIGHRISRARETRNVTRVQLSEQTGVSVKSIHQYEHADCRVAIDTLIAIASALELPITYFLPGHDNDIPPVLHARPRFPRTWTSPTSGETYDLTQPFTRRSKRPGRWMFYRWEPVLRFAHNTGQHLRVTDVEEKYGPLEQPHTEKPRRKK